MAASPPPPEALAAKTSAPTTPRSATPTATPSRTPPVTSASVPLSLAMNSKRDDILGQLPAGSSQSGDRDFNLRWEDYSSSVLAVFRNLKEEEDFVDVTLACRSRQFTAHKVVLSACSPYFRSLLKVKSFHPNFRFSTCFHKFSLVIVYEHLNAGFKKVFPLFVSL